MSERWKRLPQGPLKKKTCLPQLQHAPSGDGGLRKVLSVGEDLLMSAWKSRARPREGSLDLSTRTRGKLPPLVGSEEAVVLPCSREEVRRKLRRCFRLVRLLARMLMWLKSYARYDGYSELLKELTHHSSGSGFTVNHSLAFSKASFFAYNTNYVPQWAISMLSKPPPERSSRDVHHLALLLRTMRFFRDDFAWERQLELCRHCEYAKYEKERVILKVGHLPQYCYLLFSGSVHVSIAVDPGDDGGNTHTPSTSILRKGAIFGDVALMHNLRRTATVMCREDVECLLVGEDTCRRIFPEEMAQEYSTKMKYLQDSGLFTGWPQSAFNKMTIHSNIFRTYYGEVVECNTALSEFIYIVTKGRVDVVLQVDLTSHKASSSHTHLPPVEPHPPHEVFVCVDHLTPYQSCDLSSLLDDASPLPLTLVSRGAEVLKIPKVRLHTTPPLPCWKALLIKAEMMPRYPTHVTLHSMIASQLQWNVYRQEVLSDLLGKSPERTVAMTVLPSATTTLKQPHHHHQ